MINYPITEKAEKWLVDRLPVDLGSKAGQLLVRAIKDFKINGKPIDAARNRPELYESRKPSERKWGGFFNSTKINSSQLFQMCFAVGSLSPTHALLVAFFLGFVNGDFSIIEDDSTDPLKEQDSIIKSLKYFFRTAALAGKEKVNVFIDA